MSDDNRQNVQWAKAPISDVPRDKLLMRLDFYQENLILKGYADRNGLDPADRAPTASQRR